MRSNNPFHDVNAAERYARWRPDLHSGVIDVIAPLIDEHLPLSVAVDIGCGTGHSSRILQDLAETVIGVDFSLAMLRQNKTENVNYIAGVAERIPLRNHCCSLVSIGQALHWLSRHPFLHEAFRILNRDGTLIAYTVRFLGKLSSNSGFSEWYRDQFLIRYPVLSQNPSDLSRRELRDAGFELRCRKCLESTLALSANELVQFLLTQSNVIRITDNDRAMIEQERLWIRQGVASYLESEKADAFFGGWLTIAQRT